MIEDTFLGHPIRYWMELGRRVDELPFDAAKLLKEIAELRAKVSFYESRITEMEEFKKKVYG